MKCKFCGAEMPDEANFCGKCARPLKDNIPKIAADRAQNMEISATQTVRQGNNELHKTNLGLFSMVIGLISLIFSCMALGFLGIIGIVLGSLSVARQEARKGMAITGIVCSAIAFLVSVYVITAEPKENSSNKTYQAEQATEEVTKTPVPTEQKSTPTPTPVLTPAPTPVPTPTPTLSPNEKSKEIQKALLEGKKNDLREYSLKEVNKIAKKLLRTLSFQKNEDYDTANTVAETMVSVYFQGLETDDYKNITSNYKSYVNAKKKLSSADYKEIKKKWKNASKVISEVVSDTFQIYYDIEKNSSGSALDQIINAITGESKEYKHAYYALGYYYDATLTMWSIDDDAEYVIYSHDAFPKAGKYSLDLIPTGSTMKVITDSGFEREIDTYTLLSEKDEAEYNRIRQLKIDYDNLYDEVDICKENIEYICNSFSK